MPGPSSKIKKYGGPGGFNFSPPSGGGVPSSPNSPGGDSGMLNSILSSLMNFRPGGNFSGAAGANPMLEVSSQAGGQVGTSLDPTTLPGYVQPEISGQSGGQVGSALDPNNMGAPGVPITNTPDTNMQNMPTNMAAAQAPVSDLPLPQVGGGPLPSPTNSNFNPHSFRNGMAGMVG